MKSRYDQLQDQAQAEIDLKHLPMSEWKAMTTEQREIHYNRTKECEHAYAFTVPMYPILREPYSFDPYAHTSHMLPHTTDGKCMCQMCAQKIGIARDTRFKKPTAPEGGV